MRVLVGVQVAGGPDHCPDVHAAPHDVEQPPPGLVTAGDANRGRRTAERRHVAGGIPGAAGNDVRRVVVEDEDRRLARDARQLAVDELVDDEIPEDGDARPGELVDELQESAWVNDGLGGGASVARKASGHGCLRIQETAPMRSSVTAPAPWAERSAWSPYPVRTSTPRAPTVVPAATSCARSPTTNEPRRSI